MPETPPLLPAPAAAIVMGDIPVIDMDTALRLVQREMQIRELCDAARVVLLGDRPPHGERLQGLEKALGRLEGWYRG